MKFNIMFLLVITAFFGGVVASAAVVQRENQKQSIPTYDPTADCPITGELLGKECPMTDDAMACAGLTVCQTPCGHNFRSWAIEEWIDRRSPNRTCPVCRKFVGGRKNQNDY